ncbi:MAG: response regulator [Pseudobacteriovorax sp.]|nr:response regulator [Pseudobacteriovorax sp.]
MKQVVCIDDCDIDLSINLRIIERSGIAACIKAFQDPEEGLEWFTSHREISVDLLLLDINMPKMNGFEFLEKFQTLERKNTVVVCFVTTSEKPDEIKKAESLGAQFSTKPLTKTSFKELMTHLFGV